MRSIDTQKVIQKIKGANKYSQFTKYNFKPFDALHAPILGKCTMHTNFIS